MKTVLARAAAVGGALMMLASTPAFARADAGGGAVAATASLAQASATLTPGRYLWEDDASLGAVSILISIPDQRAYVYRGDQLVAVSTVSTGKDGKETPVGVFTILQKKEMNRSNLYDGAPMPFMQRLTWDGIAIHAGRNPGFPASHGCIRVPTEFAKKLYAATALGATVEVTDLPYMEGTPAPISDAQETASANAAAGKSLNGFLASR
jgi:lipoprotein-anchoring transpeptidase ErfK/SrfK